MLFTPAARFSIPAPPDFQLPRDANSYGYVVLAPNRWSVEEQALYRAMDLPGGPALVRLAQPGFSGFARPVKPAPPRLIVHASRALTPIDRAEIRRQATRMLRLDFTRRDAARFHRLDARWQASGRARLFRSPSFFEDTIKTVTSCNVAWPSTVNMNERLCAVLGKPVPGHRGWRTFPTAARLARARPGTLRGRCRVGYRDQRMIDLARLFNQNKVSEQTLAPLGDNETYARLLELPGIGPYAAGNIMQLLGRYSRLAIDTETHRHARVVLGYTHEGRAMTRAIERHYEPYQEFKFLSYWLELWDWYEDLKGPAHLWDRDRDAKAFTAAQMKAVRALRATEASEADA